MKEISKIPGDCLASPALGRLSKEQQRELAEILDNYLSSLEEGGPLEEGKLFAIHPDLANTLHVYFRIVEDLNDLAGEFRAAQNEQGTGREGELSWRGIGDFELVREIGRGGMGVVFEARQISLDRRVAVKLLPLSALLEEKHISRFRNEAQLAAKLQHPNIVPVFTLGVEHGIHYYAMQYIEGQSLDQVIAEMRGPRTCGTKTAPALTYLDIARLGIQAAEALHAGIRTAVPSDAGR